MDATRARLRFDAGHAAEHLHWIAAVGLVVSLVLFTMLVIRELRFAPSLTSVDAASSAASVPSEAVSVPSLIVTAGRQVRVGEAEIDAVADLGALTLLSRVEER